MMIDLLGRAADAAAPFAEELTQALHFLNDASCVEITQEMSMSGSIGSSDSGNSAVQGAQDAAMASYTQSTVADIQKEAEFSQMQGEASIGNTIAKANPTS